MCVCVCVSVCLSVFRHGVTRLHLDGILWNFILEHSLKTCREDSSFIKIWQEYRVLYMNTCTIMVRSHWILHRMRIFSVKSCKENQNTHFMFNNFFPEIVPFMRQCGKNIVELGGMQMATWRMPNAWWISKAINTCWQYTILNGFPLQRWLLGHSSMLTL